MSPSRATKSARSADHTPPSSTKSSNPSPSTSAAAGELKMRLLLSRLRIDKSTFQSGSPSGPLNTWHSGVVQLSTSKLSAPLTVSITASNGDAIACSSSSQPPLLEVSYSAFQSSTPSGPMAQTVVSSPLPMPGSSQDTATTSRSPSPSRSPTAGVASRSPPPSKA